MGAIRGLLNLLGDLIYFLSGEGTWVLRPHERIVVEAAIASLPDHIRMLLRAKLQQTMFVQRSHRQISLPRFYSSLYTRDNEAIGGDELLHKLLRVQIDVGGEKQSAHVEFFRGRIESIQFTQPAKSYAGKAVKVIGVKPGKPGLSHAAAIDRREHGRHSGNETLRGAADGAPGASVGTQDVRVGVTRQLLLQGRDLLAYLSGPSSWTLRDHEQIVADAAIRSFSDDMQTLLYAQLRQAYFVERTPEGRINVLRFYRLDRALEVDDPGFADLLLVVRIVVDGVEQVAHVTFRKGYLFSLEFPHEAASYADRPIEVREVSPGE